MLSDAVWDVRHLDAPEFPPQLIRDGSWGSTRVEDQLSGLFEVEMDSGRICRSTGLMKRNKSGHSSVKATVTCECLVPLILPQLAWRFSKIMGPFLGGSFKIAAALSWLQGGHLLLETPVRRRTQHQPSKRSIAQDMMPYATSPHTLSQAHTAKGNPSRP